MPNRAWEDSATPRAPVVECSGTVTRNALGSLSSLPPQRDSSMVGHHTGLQRGLNKKSGSSSPLHPLWIQQRVLFYWQRQVVA